MKFWIAALLFPLLLNGVVAAELNPRDALVGRWQLDVEKTRQSRMAVKKLPEGISTAPDPSKIIEKTVIFDRDTMASVVKETSPTMFHYTVMRSEGPNIYLRYEAQAPGQAPVYTHWEILGPDEAVNYLIVFSMKEPLLEDKTFATYYKRLK